MSYKATGWAYDMALAAPMKPVLVALADMADEAGTCFPGQERIANMTGLSVRTVARALVKLERLGLIVRQRRVDQFGHRTSDRYRLQMTVNVPESLPDTLPTRQIAYKADSPSLPVRNVTPTGHGGRGTTREPPENHQGGVAPTPTCPKHPNGTDEPCRPCGTARRAYDAHQAEKRNTPTHTPPPVSELWCPQHFGFPAKDCSRCAEEAQEAS
jgi:hypothetical protein